MKKMHAVDKHKWVIREAVDRDVDYMTELDSICFSSPWSREEFWKEITENPRALYIVAEDENGKLAGYAGLWAILDEGHITNVCVHPEHRKKRLGTQLINALLNMTRVRAGIKNFTLEVRVSNIAGIKLYEKFGFKEVGIRKGYYSHEKEDAAIMWLMEDDLEI